jgi:hypothetical protein
MLLIFPTSSDDETECANGLSTHVCKMLKSQGGCLVIENGKKVCKHEFPKTTFEKTTVVYTIKKSKRNPNSSGYL